MATKTKPAVGDRAIIDGAELTVLAVKPGGKDKVDLGDEDAAERADRVAKIRAEAASEQAKIEAKIQDAIEAGIAEAKKLSEETGKPVHPKNLIRAKTAIPKAEMDLHAARLQARLDGVARGVTVGVALRDLEWVEAASTWSVSGRLLSYADRQRRR